MHRDLTTGPLTRHLLTTMSFMLVTMLFQTLYFLVDLYFVGRLGKEAIAGVGLAGNLTMVVLAFTPDPASSFAAAASTERPALVVPGY